MGAYKNFSVKLSILITVFIVISFSGCFSHWDGGDATLTIYLGGRGSRVIYTLDDGTMSRLYYVIDFSGPSTFTIGPTEPGAELVSVTLFSGKWDITVTAYLDDGVYAIGYAVVEVRAGESVSTTITLDFAGEYTVAFNDVTDFVEWLASQPANTAANPYIVKLSVSDLGGRADIAGSVGAILLANNTKYVTLDLSDSTITTIPAYAFVSSHKEGKVTIYTGCETLTGITIPNGVTSIGYYAFRSCTSLTSVTIGSGVIDISNSAFDYCTSFTTINVDAGNSVYSSHDGVLYNKDKTTLIIYPVGKTGVFTIPNGVTSNGEDAFSGCIGLTGIIIPDGFNILEYAFTGCASLTSVTIQNGVISIGNSAFENCTNLASVTIPDSVTSIGEYAFTGCESLTSITIPDSVTTIGKQAFGSCGLTSVTIPASVTDFGVSVFHWCQNLTSVTILSASIGEGAFNSCLNLTSVTIGDSVIDIGEIAFIGCISLTSVTIGNSVTSIGTNAFFACKGLTSITIPASVTTIESDAFTLCDSLTRVTFKGTPSYVDEYAFDGNLHDVLNTSQGTLGTYTRDENYYWTKTSP